MTEFKHFKSISKNRILDLFKLVEEFASFDLHLKSFKIRLGNWNDFQPCAKFIVQFAI